MRIAVFLERWHEFGGAFNQALSMVVSLAGPGATTHEIVAFTQFEETRQLLSQHGIGAIRFRQRGLRILDRWSATVLGGAILRRLRRVGLRRLGRHLDAFLDDHDIDLVVLTECTQIAYRIGDHPFIVAVWDVFHRDHPEFPEVFGDRIFEQWDRVRRATLTRALAVLVDSPTLARRVAELYQVDSHRIVELPFLPSLAVRRHAAGDRLATAEGVRRKYDLPDRYVFYPAAFGALKNHLYLLEGLVDLERRHGAVLHAVFCGADNQERGNLGTVERQVQALGLTARVHFPGLVPDDDIPALYEGALALVMPAYSGPTNLPPVEAVTLGCPVIYSDLPEFREQMGDAALYCDLADVSSLADHLAALIQDPAVADRLRAAGGRLAAEIAKIDYGQILKPVFDDFAYLRRRWAWPENAS
jgi:glycosyltransferase involved in cell wall biosynthesis